MKTISRSVAAFLLVSAMALGSVAFVGCGGSSSSTSTSSASASAASAANTDNGSSSSASSAGDQDDCYGDDLPAVKSK